MNNKKSCFSIFLAILLWSCTDLKLIKKYSDIYLTSQEFHEKKLIRDDGFYTSEKYLIGDSIPLGNYNLLFRNDGTCATFRIFPQHNCNEIIDLNASIIKYGKKQKWAIPEFGVYKISHDTLFVNLYYKDMFFYMRWNIIKDRYKIIDNETLLWIFRSSPVIDPKEEGYSIIPCKFKFVPANNIPRIPNDFLLKEKWIWERGNHGVGYTDHLSK